METEIAKKVLSEWGMIYLLFFMIVWGFIRKGIPYLINLFSEIRKDFLDALKSQQDTFERTLKIISDDFVKRVEKSDNWHEKHNQELQKYKDEFTEIKELIKKK